MKKQMSLGEGRARKALSSTRGLTLQGGGGRAGVRFKIHEMKFWELNSFLGTSFVNSMSSQLMTQ